MMWLEKGIVGLLSPQCAEAASPQDQPTGYYGPYRKPICHAEELPAIIQESDPQPFHKQSDPLQDQLTGYLGPCCLLV